MERNYLIAAGGLLVLAIIATNEAAIDFIWRYIAGPLFTHAAESEVVYNGVTASEGYNIYNTTLYAVALVGAIAGISKVLGRLDIESGPDIVIGMVPFVIMGGVLRVVENAGVFQYPFNILLITPLIYFLVAGIALAALIASVTITKRYGYENYRGPLLWIGGGGVGITLLLLAPTAISRFGQGLAPPDGIGLVIGVTAVSLVAAVGIGRVLADRVPESFLATPVGELAIVAQVMDGAVTAGSISILGYGEKHIIARNLIELSGSPYAFLVVKAAVILGILAYIPQDEDRFTMLVMLGVIAVGMGPATRNLVRAILGI